jgi:hypothetical protein
VLRLALADIGGFRAAFLTSSGTTVQMIARIDTTEFAVDRELTRMLIECYESNPLERI